MSPASGMGPPFRQWEGTVSVVDVGTAGHDRVHQRQHLPARAGPTDPAGQPDQAVDQPFQLQAEDQGADQDQPGVGDQVRIIEPHLNPVQPVRYSAH